MVVSLRTVFFGAFALFILILLSGYHNGYNDDPGEELAKQYCGGCHLVPEPSILTKKSWSYLLTDMGSRLGIVDYDPIVGMHPAAVLHMNTRERLLNKAGLIPPQPLLTNDQWQNIREYYISSAPKKPLPQSKKPKLKIGLDQFKLLIPSFQPKGAVFTLNSINSQNGGLILNNVRAQEMVFIDKNLQLATAYYEPEIVVDAQVEGDNLLYLAIGDLMGSYIGEGRGILYAGAKAKSSVPEQLVSGLHRPVDFEKADLDLDGKEEFIICNFGDATGNVSIYDQQGGLVKELINSPGGIRSQVHDFNNDGKPDIAVLMGDARENISLFLNRGNHQYERKIVVECHSAYGHTYFELQDFNKDGHMDFLATNGDTDADPFNTLKRYHGIRIYLNDGKNNFEMTYFYPMYGAHFAKAADFDQDGDLDIAASAFFPDFASERPEQFVYLEDTGNMNYQAYTHPETFEGRWMIMDVGDYDLDGDTDIVLGGGYHSLGMQIDHKEKFKELLANGKALLVFENKLR
jgi:hypothetical protein